MELGVKMFRGVHSIYSVNAFSGVVDMINLEGRNLIITGGNGCGKTRFITKLFDTIFIRIAQRTYQTDSELMNEIINTERELTNSTIGSSSWSYYNEKLPNLMEQKKQRDNFKIFFNDNDQGLFTASYHSGKSVLMNFPAFRNANINAVNSVRSLASIKESSKTIATNIHQMGNSKATFFEEYLVSLKQTRAMYITEDNDLVSANKIEGWFNKLEHDLSELFEDKSLKLKFKVNSGSFEIIQDNKEPYKFQNLSSGFSAVMCIYAELLMNIEANELSPNELRGIVFIDEIDAHLHISIQKKIMGFLTKSFPLIQFVVTTHSPFVVMSVNDAVIYDLSKHEQVEDLSLYSYEAVAEGLFDTSSVSQVLMEKMNRLSSLSIDFDKNKSEITDIISILKQHENKLDEESKYYLKNAEINILKHREGGSNV
ncbi:AAA family ATPase [Citrobacter sp. S2-9]|uniref:AAA family ATPase n=1 Tax=Citrobacter enshiensis TaxID=2971264 RepID=A0ABT8PSB7_9ENTR|nr:AAA family ATPase [Citrobacter enshiensis]MDN8598997.1 AAA family ATPase [Citrobacter enshiensis]